MAKKSGNTETGREERPTIELYMFSLNQEFPVGKGHHTFLKRQSEVVPDIAIGLAQRESVESQVYLTEKTGATDWSVQWISNEWITNHVKAAGVGLREESDPLVRAVIREEDFGAIIFEPISDRVYKLNHAGIELFKDLRAAYKTGKSDLSTFKTKKFDKDDIATFVSFMEGSGLWIRG